MQKTLNNWKKKTGGLTQEEYNNFEESLTRNKEVYSRGEDLF